MPYTSNTPHPKAIKKMPRIRYQRQLNALDESVLSKRITEDDIAVEEPLQISLAYYDLQTQDFQKKILTLTMRTPGDDDALIYGFLICEGIIKHKNDISAFEYKMASRSEESADANQIDHSNAVCVLLAKHVQPDWKVIERQFTNHSSCGICGKTSLNALQLKSPAHLDENLTTIHSHTLFDLPDLLREQQAIFSHTGGLHAAGLYDNQQFVHIAEDVGRHNAVDKVIGLRCLNDHKFAMTVLVLSGRISFELVQKAIMANINVIVSVGAPSSLAVSAAKQFDLTLIGFTKTDSFNVYNGDWRITK
ncbi:formate dehydrogenase accessory sulfurtransferase FdhD [Psychromonas sp. Urea-02u-13]|uniref:formate dehydrogenase accessory sulfurtransferase FdhD n=1 Tax=Psychromonas sp. Urea-02u-13 TaxID=2058326 RepID=UPI000C34EF94|nr:formate dehydrogenase accessory sulfurtransferase FdhD [Psychromonas sp. Urea-02u-13]PKG37664.1 formate dehydrogenase family accessory protein FdhD [Psychromonas sp. Urea-02u-13]